MQRISLLLIGVLTVSCCKAQHAIDMSDYDNTSEAKVSVSGQQISVVWPANGTEHGKLLLDMRKNKPLFKTIELSDHGSFRKIASNLDPAFILTVGKRDLISQNGWNIFFDKVPNKPHQSYAVKFDKKNAVIKTSGSRTVVRISQMNASSFSGALEITFYNGSPLFDVAAVMSTASDSTAILYDAGLTGNSSIWKNIGWSDTKNNIQYARPGEHDTARNLEVKYRTVIGEGLQGSLAIFPAPHQFFYPLDEAFNLKFVWYGNRYRNMMPGFGLGIRQDPEGDKRFVPWFNAPPGTSQRLHFFCLLSTENAAGSLDKVKEFTHGDTYAHLPGYKTMSSHFHNEFIMKVVLAGKPVPAKPEFVDVFKQTGIDIVHLAEFHYTAHPKGPDEKRLTELTALFDQCRRLSDKNFLLLPGEEPNEFFGGHWVELFPKPVYWIMSRKAGQPFVTDDAKYGKVYRISNHAEMLQLLQEENGLAWTAHPRTKGSTGFPDAYKEKDFFLSDHFLGAAWKALPADLSQPRLGKRALDLLDDMNNWGTKKQMIAESDIFSITHENEMYAHLNVNYLQLDTLPDFNKGCQPVLDVMRKGKFFSGTGEVLLPGFTVNDAGPGDTIAIDDSGNATVLLNASWTFPLNFAEIISGDGEKVYRQRINLDHTTAFGKQQFNFAVNLKNRRWVRVEVWDAAADGAFTQTVWLK